MFRIVPAIKGPIRPKIYKLYPDFGGIGRPYIRMEEFHIRGKIAVSEEKIIELVNNDLLIALPY
ncbi:hypothetical protein SAMN05421636_109170 [Pricia antarctica]|uniref:Uncharacterized protein n=1 Tax=Pricia antarctica TaxID=641691 RepID=A0A1G7HGY3_9FLAO|nr:hypothetical protein SAMN05421636_109170 [Pricia antarctica]